MSLGTTFEYRPNDKLICTGSLTPDAVTKAQAEDVVQVINLCPAMETTWDEESAVQQLGMTYHNIPISGPQDLTDAAVELLLEMLDEAPGKTLIHCASSNRVGAMLALAAQKKGATVEQALAIGRSGGLTRMEPMVAQILQQRA